MSTGITDQALNYTADYINAHTFGTKVDIYSAAISSSGYTAPSDGYVIFQNYNSPGGQDAFVTANGESLIGVYSSYFGSYSLASVFVKKGMVIKLNNTFSSLTLKFIPLA